MQEQNDMFSHFRELLRDDPQAEGIERLLGAVRRHLGMDVAFISHFTDVDRMMEYVDSVPDGPLRRGQRISLEEGYCLKVVQGELPECITDTSQVPAAMRIAATWAIPIGSHLSVPVKLQDGTVYGTLCCFSFLPKTKLHERDMQLMRAFADVLAVRFDENEDVNRKRQAQCEEIRATIVQGAPRIVLQPICRIAERNVCGFEALSRFDVEPMRSPDQWFDIAHMAGVGLELESHAATKALAALSQLPPDCYISVNASPALVLSGGMQTLLEAAGDPARVVLEITEHVIVRDYELLAQALTPWRERGVRLAVDDAGAGFSSMRHILNLAPEIIKLDMSITQGIDTDAKRRAMARGLANFAHEIGSLVVAEGVERIEELDTLAQLEVDCAQGYLLSRPLEPAAAAAFMLAR